MNADAKAFLKKLVEAPSPSGFETPAQRLVKKRLEGTADEVIADVHGNIIGIMNPGGSPRIMLAGHVDEIGLMVNYIDEKGFIYFQSIGGLDANLLLALRVNIHHEGRVVKGVVGRKPPHLMPPEDRKKAVSQISQLWIDIGAGSDKEAKKRVEVGDPITFDASYAELTDDRAISRGFDDKIGAFVVTETLTALKGLRFDPAVYAVSTVQEEIGLRGAKTSAFGIDPEVGIAVDVGHASDYPGVEKKEVGDIKLGSGPILSRGPNINPILGRMMESLARRKKIPIQITGEPRGTGTDANVIQTTRSGVAAALISIPNRYMHSPVEMISLKDVDNAVKLLTSLILELKSGTSFIPG